MEAVPRLPMLSFEPKPYFPKNAQFGSDLMNLIKQHYLEDPNNYLDEIQQLEKLRQQAAKLNKDIDGIAVLKRYFCQLHFLQKRFPMIKDLSVNSEISWKDLLSSSNSRKVDYRSEFTTTLYNIGSLHTQLGAADDRTTAEGLKLTCTHFQCAAWAFQYLREVTSISVRPDFEHGFLEFLISTCLAQAQECIAEKSITDNRKSSISAKVVTQICEYYEAAKHALSRLIQEDSILIDYGIKNPQACMNYLRYKQPYYKCLANLFLGMQAEEDEKMGERVAYFELASDELKEAFRYARDIPGSKDLDEALSFTYDVVEGKRKNANNENEFIYHEEVPPKDNLQKVKGAPLVKCIAFDFNDPDISGPDIFSKLISMKVHQLSSVYSEEKAKLLRSVSSSVEEKESELNTFMQSFKLDFLNLTEDPNALPEELIERCAACEAKPTVVQDLLNSMNKLADAHREVEIMMKETTELIEEENKAEEEYQIMMKTNRPPSIVATDLKCEANRYLEALKKATESNDSLRNAISAHVNNLRILSLPLIELERQLPTVSFDYSPEEKNIVKELQRLVDKVDEMKNQRALLMLQLRDSLRNDDITEQIVLSDDNKSDFSTMVAKEIAKHQNVVTLIEQNLKAQANILKAITNAYAAYAPIRKVISDTAHKRGIQINALIESFDVSDDVLKKTVKGLEFYRKLQVNVRKLLNRVRGTCKVQEEERLQMYLKEGKKLPRKNLKVSTDNVSVHEKPFPSTTPKLKDYIGAKPFSKAANEIPLPYSQYYATVTRPPPVGSETTVIPTAAVEPSGEFKNAMPSTAVPTGSSTYSYSYFNPSLSAYQSPPLSQVTANMQCGYPGSYPVQVASGITNMQYSATNVPITYGINTYGAIMNHSSYSVANIPSYGVSSMGASILINNISRYTNAGHHNTQNIESSSKSLDGRSFATQYAAAGLTTPISNDYQLYYSSQYGHQYSDIKTGDVSNELFISKENETGDQSLTKRNSLTYIQAGSNGSVSTISTFSINGSNSSSTEKKEESNLDLLADLEFDVPDIPLLPIPEAATANKVIEKLTDLNLTNAVIEK